MAEAMSRDWWLEQIGYAGKRFEDEDKQKRFSIARTIAAIGLSA